MKAVLEKEFKEIIKEAFSSDKELVEKWHIASGNGLDACVDKTIKDLSEEPIDFYLLLEDEQMCGFFGKNKTSLVTIFVHPEYRKKQYMGNVLKIIHDKFDNRGFFTGCYTKNSRAIAFFLKNGGIFVKELFKDGHSGVLIYIKGNNLCHS